METLKIFLLPTEPVYSRIIEIKTRLRDEIGNYFYWDYEPHISLVYLKISDDNDHLPAVSDLVDTIVRSTPTFDVTLNKILTPGRGVIFVDIEKSLPLRSLTNQLFLDLRDYVRTNQVPIGDFEKYLKHHITIGNYIKGEKYARAAKLLEKEKLPGSFEANRIVVYREDPATRKNHLIREIGITG